MYKTKKPKPKRLFKATIPTLDGYIGRIVQIKNEKVKIKTIVGNVGMTLGRDVKNVRPQYYEINGEYLISMLRFHAQMEGATDITEEQFKQFEAIEFWSEKSSPTKNEKTAEEIVNQVMKKAEGKTDG